MTRAALVLAATVAALTAAMPAVAQQNPDRRDARLACREWTARELRVPIDRVEIQGQPTPYAAEPGTFRFAWKTSTGAEGVCRVRDGVIRKWEITFEAPNRPSPQRLCRLKVAKVLRYDVDAVDVDRVKRDGAVVTFDWTVRGLSGNCRVNAQNGSTVLVIP